VLPEPEPVPPVIPDPEPGFELPKGVVDVPGVVTPGDVPLVPVTLDVPPPPKRLTELSRSSVGSYTNSHSL